MTPTTAAAVESASTVVQLYDITKTSFNNNNNGESSEAVLIMPAVCIGNVGQLAIDILLETYKDSIQHVAALHHPLVVPCFGMNPYGDVKNAHASHPIDMYRLNSQEQENSSTVYYLMQQRAPASAGCQVQFANDIMTWISSTETVKFSAVWILGSLDATLRQDEDLQGSAVRSIYSLEHGDIDDTMIYSTMVKQCEECGVTALGDWRNIKKEYVQYEGHMPWPLIQAAEEHGVSAVGLVSFVIEGDNRGDAFEMSKTALRVMKLPVKGESTEDVSDEHSGTGRRERELVEPKSWRL